MATKRTLRVALGALSAIALLAFAPTIYAAATSASRIGSAADVPAKPVAIVFGAATYANGDPSPFLQARLDLALQLFQQGKVRAILVSGDNRHVDYNEPDAMRTYLIKAGVPPVKVVADYAGFDTYSTCMRAKRIFGVDEAILTSQSYHLPRAVATCRAVGLDAWGVGDDSGSHFTNTWWLGSIREVPGNLKATYDVVTGRRPVMGPHETGIEVALRP